MEKLSLTQGLVLTALGYGLGVIVVRWHMIARPIRNQLRARLETIEAELQRTYADASGPTADIVDALMKRAREMQSVGWGQLSDFVFWSRGQETATWQFIDEAETVLAGEWSEPKVAARLDTLIMELENNGSPKAKAVAQNIRARLRPRLGSGGAAASVLDPKARAALLQEALRAERGLLHDTDIELDNYSNKFMWYTAISLLAIVLLGLAGPVIFEKAVNQEGWLLAGAVGGVLSRLMLAVQKPSPANDYGLRWMALFLSPLVGALAAWAGMALLFTGAEINLFSDAVKDLIRGKGSAAFVGLAVLFGLSERLVVQLAGSVEDHITPDKPAAPTAGATGQAKA